MAFGHKTERTACTSHHPILLSKGEHCKKKKKKRKEQLKRWEGDIERVAKRQL